MIGDIIAVEGDKKTLSVNVKNVGRAFLNNCMLIIKGEISSWAYSTQIEGVAPGENIDFMFDINVPEEVEAKDYSGELEIKCDEGSDSQDVKVRIPGGLQLVKVGEIIHEKDILNVSYTFDRGNLIGEEASVEIWIVNEDGVEVRRFIDSFGINRDGVIERNVLIELPEDLAGIYSVYFALSSDLDNYARKAVVLGKSRGTGFAIFDSSGGKMAGYVVFLLIVGVGIFFILKGHREKTHKVHKSENKWLFRKK